jgi:hypothetical protein
MIKRTKNLALTMFFLLMAIVQLGCQEQNVRLSEKDKNQIDEIVVLVETTPSLHAVGGGGRNSYAWKLGAGPRGELFRMQMAEDKSETLRSMVGSLNEIVLGKEFKSNFFTKIKNTIESALGAKVTKVKFVNFNVDNFYVDPETGKVAKYVALVGLDVAVSPSVEMIDAKMSMKIFYQPDENASPVQNENYSPAKVFLGNFYYQSSPAQGGDIDNAKVKMKEGLKIWRESDLMSDNAVPYPWKEAQILQNQYVKYWAKDNARNFRDALGEVVVDFSEMLEIELLGSESKKAESEVSVFRKDFRNSVSANDVMNKKLKGYLLVSDERRSIIRGVNNSLYSVSKHEAMTADDFNYDQMFLGLMR